MKKFIFILMALMVAFSTVSANSNFNNDIFNAKKGFILNSSTKGPLKEAILKKLGNGIHSNSKGREFYYVAFLVTGYGSDIHYLLTQYLDSTKIDLYVYVFKDPLSSKTLNNAHGEDSYGDFTKVEEGLYTMCLKATNECNEVIFFLR